MDETSLAPRPADLLPIQAATAAAGSILLTLAALAALGLPSLAPFAAGSSALGALLWPATLGVALLSLALQQQGFVFHWRTESTKVSLDEIALFVGAVLLPPAHVPLAIAASATANQILHRRALPKATFNVAQYAVAASVAASAAWALRAAGAPSPWHALVAPPVFSLATCLLVSLMFSRLEGAPALRILARRFGRFILVGATLGVSLGLVLVALWLLAPVAVLAVVPVFLYLRRFGRLTEWADDELRTHQRLAETSAELAGSADLDALADQVLRGCHDILRCGEAQLALAATPSHEARFWRATFGAGASASGGVSVPLTDARGRVSGALSAFPQPGQRGFGEREHQLLRTIAATSASAAANTEALQDAAHANRALVRSEARYRSIFDTGHVLIHVVDGHGRIVEANPAACELAGIGHAEMSRRRIEEVFLPEGVAAILEELPRRGELSAVEVRLRAGSQPRHVLMDARELAGEEDARRYVVLSRDITHLKLLESSLREAMDQQRETIRRLENANRELEEFTLWTTHDMREPLRSIGTIAQFLHEDIDVVSQDEARDMARRIHQGSERLKDRVKALHAFSRIVQADDAFEDVPLSDVLTDVLASLELQVAERRATVALPAGPLPTVRAQRQRLHQVFANLIENALKYGREEAPRIEIGCEAQGATLRLHVRDDGPGIPPTYHERIFQLFQRGPETGKPGSGAGLAIVKRIVEQHGGRVWVESLPGEGACFRFELPAGAPGRAASRLVVR